jgi:uncharacterized membrane protein
MPDYVWISLGGALALALSSLVGKAVARYRICDPGLTTWLQGLVTAGLAGILCVLLRCPFPWAFGLPVASLALCNVLAMWLLNHALQEGDASTVIPLMGLKIPMTALLASVWLGEAASPRTWVAVACSGLAMSLFGSGKQGVAQGGHGYRPMFAMILVLFSTLAYSVSDLIAGRILDDVNPISILLWSSILWAPLSGCLLALPRYRQYRIARLDVLLLALRGSLVLAAVYGLYTAFRLADGVILPNVVYGARGLFAVAAGYALNRSLKVPMERQIGPVYAARAIGTALLSAAVFLAAGQS